MAHSLRQGFDQNFIVIAVHCAILDQATQARILYILLLVLASKLGAHIYACTASHRLGQRAILWADNETHGYLCKTLSCDLMAALGSWDLSYTMWIHGIFQIKA